MRNVKLTLGGTLAYPVEFIGAVYTKITEIEKAYAKNPDLVKDVSAVSTPIQSNSPFYIFVAKVTIVKATGTYTFEYQEKAANPDESKILNPDPVPPTEP